MRDKTIEEAAEELGISEAEVRDMLRTVRQRAVPPRTPTPDIKFNERGLNAKQRAKQRAKQQAKRQRHKNA